MKIVSIYYRIGLKHYVNNRVSADCLSHSLINSSTVMNNTAYDKSEACLVQLSYITNYASVFRLYLKREEQDRITLWRSAVRNSVFYDYVLLCVSMCLSVTGCLPTPPPFTPGNTLLSCFYHSLVHLLY